jgi:predicted fused transcriptional regulator/phosphomethylpyrimidine kinase
MALMITSRRVIARASRHTCRSIFSIVRHYRSWRTCLNVYDPDISYVYDKQSLPRWRGYSRHANNGAHI